MPPPPFNEWELWISQFLYLIFYWCYLPILSRLYNLVIYGKKEAENVQKFMTDAQRQIKNDCNRSPDWLRWHKNEPGKYITTYKLVKKSTNCKVIKFLGKKKQN